MKWINFLHFYQPVNQYPEILKAIVNQSYSPILQSMLSVTCLRTTINVSGSLLEVLDANGHTDILDTLRKLHIDNKVEFTGTAKYHAFLPLQDENEIYRQIKLNEQCLAFYIGSKVKIEGFFPPEMAYSPKLAPILQDLNYKWIVLDEIANIDKEFSEYPGNTLPVIKDTQIHVIYRNRRLSNLIMSALVRSKKELYRILDSEPASRKYIVTGMDGETFGHHRPGLVSVLCKILENTRYPVTSVGDLINEFSASGMAPSVVEPKSSTWASSPDDLEKGVQFLSWSDPENEIHALQWQLQKLVLAEFNKLYKGDLDWEKTRHLLDVALASDHFWWASAKPWWGLEMIEEGAFRLLEVIKAFKPVDAPESKRALELYTRVVAKAFEWQRTGIIRKRREIEFKTRIPFVERTLERGGEHIGIFNAFMTLMRKYENSAARRREYEQAVMWRDAQENIKSKNDIYDAVHAVDLLRQKIPFDIVEKLLDKYTEPYKKIRGGQPEQRGN